MVGISAGDWLCSARLVPLGTGRAAPNWVCFAQSAPGLAGARNWLCLYDLPPSRSPPEFGFVSHNRLFVEPALSDSEWVGRSFGKLRTGSRPTSSELALFRTTVADWNDGIVEYWGFAHFVPRWPVRPLGRQGAGGFPQQICLQSAIRNPKSAIETLALFRTNTHDSCFCFQIMNHNSSTCHCERVGNHKSDCPSIWDRVARIVPEFCWRKARKSRNSLSPQE